MYSVIWIAFIVNWSRDDCGCQAIVVRRSSLRGEIRLNRPNESKGLTHSEAAAVAASYVRFRLLL
jgi:hypothetical protein